MEIKSFDLKQELQADGGGSRERRSSHVDTNPPPKSDVLVECDYCDRKFAADRIQRHMEASNDAAVICNVNEERENKRNKLMYGARQKSYS